MRSIKQTTPLRTPQLYERIAERIARDISLGIYAPGERLPSERELAAHLEVGRTSLREAIAALQMRGILDTRAGAGSFVATDGPHRAATLLSTAAVDDAVGDMSPSALLDARAILEPGVARLAAQRGQPDPVAEDLVIAMEQSEVTREPAGREPTRSWNDFDRLFHLQLAVMTGNSALVALAQQIAAIMDQPLWQSLRDASLGEIAHARVYAAEHRMLYEAIVDGDVASAEFYAAAHLRRVRRYMTLQ